jgi:hypothetical protein
VRCGCIRQPASSTIAASVLIAAVPSAQFQLPTSPESPGMPVVRLRM